MKLLPIPFHDDISAVKALSKNKRIKDSAIIKASAHAIIINYKQYVRAEGNAHIVSPIKLSHDLTERLSTLYASPNKDIEFINQMRSSSSYKSCPMCGSLAAGTLDHFFSQATYPEFSIFSKNLVAACNCNSARQEKLKGHGAERLLHPYFDECLSERLLRCSFSTLGNAPSVEVRLAIDAKHSKYTEISFHTRTIIDSTEIKDFLLWRWSKMITKPESVIRYLEETPESQATLNKWLLKEIGLLDGHYESKNNWASIFITGLLEPKTENWLFNSLTRATRKPGMPLV